VGFLLQREALFVASIAYARQVPEATLFRHVQSDLAHIFSILVEDILKARSKTSKRNVKPKRRASFKDVTPVVIQANAKSRQATIPVSIQRSGDSEQAQALIPVAVKTTAGKEVRRAAVVPVTVKSAPKRTPRRRSLAVRPAVPSHSQIHSPEPLEARDMVSKGVVRLTDLEETAVMTAGHLTMTVLDIFPRVMRTAMKLPLAIVKNATAPAQVLHTNATTALDRLAA